jgi:hypothetical protein
MMARGLALAAAILLAVPAAASDQDLSSQILACSAEPDGAAQLACYNQIAARLRAAQTPAPATAPSTPPAAEAATEPIAPAPPPQQPTTTAQSAPPVQTATQSPPADFGGDTVPFHHDAAEPPDSMTAHVVSFSYNFYHRFTVSLDNGQVWRQKDEDNAIAKLAKNQTVTITRGFLDAFHLKIEGEYGNFEVRRIQ